MLSVRFGRGFTLTELMIGIAIVAILLVMALPNFTIFMQNTQIKNAAETALAGISLARVEAVRRNVAVQFNLVSDLTAACALSATSANWVVSLQSPAGLCDVAPSDVNPPQTIQAKSAQEGTRNVAVATSGGAALTFNSLGRVSGAGITQLDFSNPTGGVCEHVDPVNGTMRCLRILVSTGGQVKMCDPKLPVMTPPVDPRECQ